MFSGTLVRLLFRPRVVVHAMWNPTDIEAIVLEFISPAGFEGFFEEMGALQEGAPSDTIREIATPIRTNTAPELIAELSERYDVFM
jgi:hypothetical protein